MATSFIRWKKEDYQNLQRATRQFNTRIKLLNKYDLVDYDLPMQQNYQDLKKHIVTREQLNQTLKSLNSFQTASAIDEVTLKKGQTISRWQMQEIEKRRPQAIEKIENRLMKEQLRKDTQSNYKGLSNDTIKRLESTLKTLKNYDKKTGQDLKYAISRIMQIGSKDYEVKLAMTFRTNFMKTFEAGLSNYENYDVFKKKLDSIKDPQEFYDYVSRSEFLMDSFVLYDSKSKAFSKIRKNGSNGYDYSAYGSNEEAFNNALTDVYNFDLITKQFKE